MVSNFKNDEKLFRAVRHPNQKPNFWSKDGKRISGLAFKNRYLHDGSIERGVSVERQNDRNTETCIKSVQTKLEGAVVSIKYSDCTSIKIKVEQTCKDSLHCELINNSGNNCTYLTNFQCQKLADMAFIETLDFHDKDK